MSSNIEYFNFLPLIKEAKSKMKINHLTSSLKSDFPPQGSHSHTQTPITPEVRCSRCSVSFAIY